MYLGISISCVPIAEWHQLGGRDRFDKRFHSSWNPFKIKHKKRSDETEG
jgi:hypothetical protein